MDSELFGYIRGAFSGAYRDHPGLFEQADGGTFFLDEVGDMPAELQTKVLRAIQEGEVRRLGDTRVRKVNVRIVTATNRDLSAMVGERPFREDLLYRLKGYVVELPPLRQRDRDVVQLARQFLQDAFPSNDMSKGSSKGISRDAEAILLAYKWPGNVRELQNVIRAAGIDAGRAIRPEHLAKHLDHAVETPAPNSSRTAQILKVVDRTGSASPAEIRTEMSLPRSTLLRALSDRVATGMLRRLGDGRSTRYARADTKEGVQLTARQKLIMRHVEDVGPVTRLECSKITGKSIRTASRDLSRLVALGHLVSDGRTGNSAGYMLVKTDHAPPAPTDLRPLRDTALAARGESRSY